MTNAARAIAASVATQREKGGQGTCPTCPWQPRQHRSEIDHNMFFAVVKRAFESWPDDHHFCPADEKELYGWLLIEAGYCVSGEVNDKDTNAIRKSARVFMDLAGESNHPIYYMSLKATKRGVRVTIPRSLSYKTAGKRQFEDTRSKVYEVIESVLGVPVETLKREAREAA
jgi:hypothetical protein